MNNPEYYQTPPIILSEKRRQELRNAGYFVPEKTDPVLFTFEKEIKYEHGN
jgi:hypothetical protein